MPKTQDKTEEEILAELKASDAATKRVRAELDAATLEKIVAQAAVAKEATLALEALCGDLVSEFGHHALKMQAPGGASVQIGNVSALAEQGLTEARRFLDAPEA